MFGGTTGRPQEATAAELAVVPNPSAGGDFHLTLTLVAVGFVGLTILDAVGRSVRAEDPQTLAGIPFSYSLSVPGPAGVYVLRLALPGGRVFTRRLVRL